MKTRRLALVAVIGSVSLLTACAKNGSSTPGTVVTPTVTVTAPATAVPGSAFDVSWTSTDATSCSADFTSVTTTTGSASVTETTEATKTYSVTCTGAGVSGTGKATVAVAIPRPEGLWQGTTGDGRTISGAVTKEGGYWLAYTRSASDATVVGFYAGTGAATMTTAPSGTFSSQNLREVNFDTGFAGGNSVATGTIAAAPYTAKTSFLGSFAPGSGGSVTGATFTASSSGSGDILSYSPGALLSMTGSGSIDNAGTLTVNYTGILTIVPLPTPNTMTITATETLPGTFSGLTWAPSGTGTWIFNGCSGALCAALKPLPETFTVTSATGTFNLASTSVINTSVHFTDPQTFDMINAETYSNPNVTLSSLPSITGDTFSFPSGGSYNPAYESPAALATVAGSYTAGSTGIGNALYADASLTIASDGSIVGTEAASFCNYSATIAPHATGNLYDVTAITFSNAAGGTCAYTGVTFTGVATYDGAKLTLTALNTALDKGFMVIATH